MQVSFRCKDAWNKLVSWHHYSAASNRRCRDKQSRRLVCTKNSSSSVHCSRNQGCISKTTSTVLSASSSVMSVHQHLLLLIGANQQNIWAWI